MESAIIGIVGVVVGAVITGGAEYLMSRREDRYARRSGVRLLCMDLYKVLAVTTDVANSGEWGPERGALPGEAYLAHAGTLARVLPPAAWKKVEGSILGVRRLEGIRVEMVDDGRFATPDEVNDFRRIRDFITSTLQVLDTELRTIKGEPSKDVPC